MKNKVGSSDQNGKKNKLLTIAFACVVASSMAVGACAPENEDAKPVFRDEAGVYYCVVDGEEYQVALKEGMATLLFDDVTSATYVYEGDKLVMKDANGVIDVALDGNVLTVELGGKTYTCLKKVDYTVTFDSNGGSSVDAITVTNGKTISQPAAPTKDGYDFVAWYTDSEFKNAFAFDADVVVGDITLYAYYVEKTVDVNEFTVKFDTNGGNQIDATTTVGGKLYSLPVAKKQDAEFIGWWLSDDNDASKLTCQYTGQSIYASTTLYAVYKSDAPAVSVTADKISWTVAGIGASYSVTITDENGVEDTPAATSATSINYDFASKAPGQYKVEVKVNGKTATAYYNNKTLAKVSKFSVIQPGILVYNAVEGATQYLITVDCGNDQHKHLEFNNGSFTSFNFANCEMQEGGITFTVKATGAGYAPSVSDQFVYSMDLEEIEVITYDENTAIVEWSVVDNAIYYAVEVVCDEQTVNCSTTKNIFSLEGFSGELTVRVTPVTDGFNSPKAKEISCNINRIKAPTGVKQYSGNAGERITWNAVEGAVSYKVKAGAEIIETTETTIAVPDSLLVAGSEYQLSVMAVAETEAQNSLWSTPVEVKYQKLTDVSYANGVVSWNAVAGARAYGVTVGDTSYTVDNGDNFAKVEFTKAGETEITVCFYDFYYTELGSISMSVNVHELAFNVSGGEAVDSMFVVTGDAITLPTTTCEGRVFEGWYNVPGGPKNNGAEYDYGFYNANSSIVLYAYWTAKPEEVKLVVDQSEGFFAENVYEQNATVYVDETYTLPTATAAVATNIFAGWYDADGVQYTDAAGNSLDVWQSGMEDKVLYAKFESAFDFTLINDATYGKGFRISGTTVTNNLTEVVIPATYVDDATGEELPVIEIAPGAFYYCDNVQKISIPETVKLINFGSGGHTAVASSFQFCSALTEIEVYCHDQANHANHECIFSDDGNGALLKKVAEEEGVATYELCFVPHAKKGTYTVPDSVVSIGANVFLMSNLSKVVVPASVASIGNGAFSISSIMEVEFLNAATATMSDSVLELQLGKNLFNGCGQLQKVTFPNKNLEFSTTGFDTTIFTGCNLLETVSINGVDGNYLSNSGVICDNTGMEILFCPAGYLGDANGKYVVPNVVNRISSNAFKNCRKIKAVEINEFVTYVGKSAFEGCVELQSVKFKGTETSTNMITIDSYAFNGCNSLTSVNLPANLLAVRAFAFAGTKSLKTVEINTADKAMFDANVFTDGTKAYLETVKLGKSVKAFADIGSVFSKCEIKSFEVDPANQAYASVGGILLSNDKTELLFAPYGEYNFEGGAAFTIPDSVTTIGVGAFAGRTELNTITIPATVTTIKDGAFAGSGITKLVFENRSSALTIGANAFNGCEGLTELTLVENITTLGNGAFDGCSAITAVTIPATLTQMDPSSVFNGCTLINSFDVAAGNTAFATVSNVVYGKTEGVATTLYMAANMAGEIVVPKTVTQVAPNAFNGTTGVTKVTFEHDGTAPITIGEGAFFGAIGLKEVVLPEGITEIGHAMFEECIELEKVVIPSTVEMVRMRAFSNCQALSEIKFTPGTAPLVFEEGKTYNTYSRKWFGSTKERIFYNCYSLKEMVFPERTTRIGAYVFHNETGIEKVVIPSTVEMIGGIDAEDGKGVIGATNGYTFANATNLREVIFAVDSPEYNPDGKLVSKLTHLSGQSFASTAITSMKVPDSVIEMSSQIFMGASKLEEVWMPAGVTELSFIGTTGKKTVTPNLFSNCTSLHTVHLPDTLTTLGNYTFNGCTALENITLPANLVDMSGGNLFMNTTSLKSITIPNGITAIANNTFSGSGLTSIVIPKGITSIGNSAFKNTALESVTFEEGSALTSIGNEAFSGTPLKSVTLPASVKTLGTKAFAYCDNLTSINIPANVTSIAQVFEGSENLNAITVEGNKFAFDAEDKTILSVDGTTLMAAFNNGNADGVVTIPSTITTIGASAFRGHKWVTKVIVPASVTAIQDYAFYDCFNLKSVVFLTDNEGNYGIKSLGQYLFSVTNGSNAGVLKEFTVPASVTTVGQRIFANNATIEKVVWNANVNFPNYAFQNATKLSEIEVNGRMTTLGSYSLSGTASLAEFEIPSTITAFGNNVFSSSGIKEVIFPENMTQAIPNTTFSACKNLERVVLPKGITTIGNSAFSNCSSLKSINLENITSIGSAANAYTFQNCTSLKEITITHATKINGSAFSGCKALTTVNVIGSAPFSPQGLGASAFANCSSLTSIELPYVVALDKLTFSGCTSLERVYMPRVNTITKDNKGIFAPEIFDGCYSLSDLTLGNINGISDYMFRDCSSLVEFNIPSTVQAIGAGAFENAGLKSVTIPASVVSIGENAFYGNAFAEIEIPATVGIIGAGAFSSCKNLDKFVVDARNAAFKSSIDIAANNKALADVLYDRNGILISYPAGRKVEGNILDLTNLGIVFGDGAFAGCQYINAVKMPEEMTTIPNGAFEDSGIYAMEIKSNITTVGENAFKNCKNLINLAIYEGVTMIMPGAFDGCESLTTVSIPSTITQIMDYTFANSGLTSIELPESVYRIRPYAFQNTQITEFIVPDHIEAIEEYAFADNSKLTELVINPNLVYLGGFAFANTPLETVVIPVSSEAALKNPTNYASGSAGGIQEIRKPKGNFFNGCDKLKTVVIEGKNRWMENEQGAFYNCTALESVTFGETYDNNSIGLEMFVGCTSLKTLELPASTKYIASKAFMDAKLESIVLRDIVEIAADSFAGWTADQTIYVNISEAEANVRYKAGWSGDATVVYNYEG